MKTFLRQLSFLFISFFSFFISAHTQGIVIVDAVQGEYLQLNSSHVEVVVNNQVALVKSRGIFINLSDNKVIDFKYGFPLNDRASAIDLRWQLEGKWKEAEIATEPQDTTLPGTGAGGGPVDPKLNQYLGATPLLFDLNDTLASGDSIEFELTYVELLPYNFNKVSFVFPSDISLVQPSGIPGSQYFQFSLSSERRIEDLQFLNHEGEIQLNPNFSAINYASSGGFPTTDYAVEYELSSDELGILSMSTLVPDEVFNCDTLGQGYVTLVIEPESNTNTAVIQKNFTLVIDRSGSMEGSKFVQAINAARFIVNNLNFGDQFNIIDFGTQVNSFRPRHVPFNAANQNAALSYLKNVRVKGGTNISATLSEAISQFGVLEEGAANIIIFFTDGLANGGIEDTQGILDLVNKNVNTVETEIFLFTFGIGNDVDRPLLTRLARENNGLVEFLGNDELQERITDFFLRINNPVLINTTIEINPPLIYDIHPFPLPNLYKGQQLIISGRYAKADELDISLKGQAFNLPVQYNYTFTLANTIVDRFQFLPKIWAKSKIEDLSLDFYSLPASSEEEAAILEDSIKNLSTCFGVISDFTSFAEPVVVTETEELTLVQEDKIRIQLTPNPFTDQIRIQYGFKIHPSSDGHLAVYDLNGKLVHTMILPVNSLEGNVLFWDGRDQNGRALPSGHYLCVFIFDRYFQTHKIIKL